jgi:hypothetical protein
MPLLAVLILSNATNFMPLPSNQQKIMSADESTPLLINSPSNADLGPDAKQEPVIPTPLPKLQLWVLFLIQFAEPVTAIVVYPFIVQLVRDTGITGGDEAKNGYYAGFIVSEALNAFSWMRLNSYLQESLFYTAEALTTLQWGRLSDRIGRKPPLVFGMLGLAVVVTDLAYPRPSSL